MDHQQPLQRMNHPKDNANIFSNLLFLYTLPLFKKSLKKELKEEDLYKVPSNNKSKFLVDNLLRKCIRLKRDWKNSSIFRLLWVSYGPYYLALGVTHFLVDAVILFFQPYAISKIISHFENNSETTKTTAYLFATTLIVIKTLNCFYQQNNNLWLAALGIRIRAAFFSLIYRKIFKIDFTDIKNVGMGKFITLITKDVQTLSDFVIYGNDILVTIVKMVIICVTLYVKIGKVAVAGICLLWMIVPFQLCAAAKIFSLEKKMCQRTEVRYRILKEAFSAIKVLKMYSWENIFKEKATEARRKEIFANYAILFIRVTIMLIADLGLNIAKYVLLIFYLNIGNKIKPQDVFFIITCFRVLRNSLTVRFQLGLIGLGKTIACARRIEQVLKAVEVEIKQVNELKNTYVELSNVSVFLNHQILQNVNLNLCRPCLTIITGPINSGKTLLLETILGELKTQGYIKVEGSISYSSQEPWLFPSTIRQNILFGEKYNEKRYQEILRVCALDYDCELLENGDLTFVEDDGANLSKGQRVRINLARAVYKDSNIYLLDDCLSSLDTIVRSHILQECICKFLGSKLVILVSQKTSDFKFADKVVFLSNGQVESLREMTKSTQTISLETDQVHETFSKLNSRKTEDGDVSETTKLILNVAPMRRMYEEKTKNGEVSWEVYRRYFKSGGGFGVLFVIVCIYIGAQVTTNYNDKLMRMWVDSEQKAINSTLNVSSEPSELIKRDDNLIYLYGIIIFLATFSAILREVSLLLFLRKASIEMHKKILNVFNTSMQFFDMHLIGNILNRFSKDFSIIDELLPLAYLNFLRQTLIVIGVFILIIIVNTTFIIPSGIFLAILVTLRYYYVKSGRSLRRLEATTRSPVVRYINSTLKGITTIRALHMQDDLICEFDDHQDLFTSATYILKSNTYAFCYILDSLSILFIAVVLIKLLLFDDGKSSAGNVGLALSQASLLVMNVQFGTRQWADVENLMTSVERVLEYADTDLEEKQVMKSEKRRIERGEIEFDNVSLTYPNSREPTLKNISFRVAPNEKIGIAGRTGSGKSSLFSVLYRLYDFVGKISIDDVDIKTMSLENLRTSISIIPQDDVLFSGTIRDNIDPKRKCSDEEIWRIIESVNLRTVVSNLDDLVIDDGRHFSVGQKHLFSLARAMTCKNKILLLDEPTACLDPDNSILIQNTIWRTFSESTVLMIAHTPQTCLKCDKVIALDRGEIVEYGPPSQLLKNKEGIFYKLSQTTEIPF